MPNQQNNLDSVEDRDIKHIAMNIVHQLGDALYDALPKDIAHEHFVDARQKTNDVAIYFAEKLIRKILASHTQAVRRGLIKELEDGQPVVPPETKEYSQGRADCNEEWLVTLLTLKN